MKTSKFFFSTLIAAAAMTATAYAADEAETILINFASQDNGKGDASWGVWNEITKVNASGEVAEDNVALLNSEGESTSATLSYVANNTWGDDVTGILKGYLDDGNGRGVAISVTTSFLVADVTIYCSTDSNNKKFTAKEVNGVYYTYSSSDSMTIVGDDAWGATGSSSIVDGVNALNVSGVNTSGGSISIYSPGTSSGDRGCVAALKIVEASKKYDYTLAAENDLTWTSSSLAGDLWNNASQENRWSYANIALSGDATISVVENIDAIAISVTESGKLVFCGDASINMVAVGSFLPKISLAQDVSLEVQNAINFSGGGWISGAVSTSGEGVLNVSGGILTLEAWTSVPNVSVSQEGTLNVGDVSSSKADLTSVLGAGTVAFNAAPTDHSAGIKLGDGFTGTVRISGNVNLPLNTELGGAARVILDNAYLWTGEEATYGQDFDVVGSVTNIGQEGVNKQRGPSGNITYTGSFTLLENASFAFEQGKTRFKGNFTGKSGSRLYVVGGTNIEFLGEANIDALTLGDSTLSADLSTEVYVASLVIGYGDGVQTAQLSGKWVVSGSLTQTGTDNGEKLLLGEASTLVINDYLGAHTDAYNGLAQTDITLGKNATLSAKSITHTDGLTLRLNEGASVSTERMCLTAAWAGAKVHSILAQEGTSDAKLIAEAIVIGSNRTNEGNNSTTLKVENVRLEIGAGGIAIGGNGEAPKTMSLKNATLGVRDKVDAWSSFVDTTLEGTSNVDVEERKSITLSGVLSDGVASGTLSKVGAGTLVLSGNNSYSGGTTISAGTLVANHENALGKGGVSVANQAYLALGTDVTIHGNLSGEGTVILAEEVKNAVLTLNSNSDQRFDGGFSNGKDQTLNNGYSIGLIKAGTGELALTGSSYFGGGNVSVNAGTLYAANPGSLSGANVSVATGAKLKVSPDRMGVYASSVELAEGAQLLVDLAYLTSPVNVDESTEIAVNVIVASSIKFGDYTLEAGESITLPDGYVKFENAEAFTEYAKVWSYNKGVLSLTLAIPEPSLFGVLAGLGALALVGTRRRRKKA